MNRFVLTAALSLVAASLPALAQQTQPMPDGQQPAAPITRPYGHMHKHNPQREAAMLSRRLNLTPDQTARLEPILADREQKVEALRANTSLTPEDMRQQMRAVHQQARTQLAGVLTPDQLEQMKAMHHRHKGHGAPSDQPGPSAA